MEHNLSNINAIKHLVEYDFIVVPVGTSLADLVKKAESSDFAFCFFTDLQNRIIGYIPQRSIWQAAWRSPQLELEAPLDSQIQSCPFLLTLDSTLMTALKVWRQSGSTLFPVFDQQKLVAYCKIDKVKENLINTIICTNSELQHFKNQFKHKDDFTNIVSHDLRNPLGVISICCDYLLSFKGEEGESLSQLQQEFIERILSNSKRALSLVQGLLDIAKSKSGLSLNFRKMNAAEYLNNIVNDFKYLAEGKEIKILLEVNKSIEVNIDPQKFGQIIENLLANAIKFSPRGKKIFLSCNTEKNSGKWETKFSVRDEGPGIPKEKHEILFKKFEQGEDAKALGVGLGLFIVSQFAQLHHGRIEVCNNHDKGSTFSVFVPSVQDGQIRVSRPSLQNPVKKRLKVLAVEDDDEILEYLTSTLEELDLDIVTASAGDSAYRAFCENSIDLVVSDLRIPKLDGFELLQKIKNIKPDLPYILITGCYDHIDDKKAKKIFHADKILHKPFLGEDLLDSIEAILPED
ncbi:MAG: ATP-binding protein [Oligoflexales bacterium]